MKNVSDKGVDKLETHVSYLVTFFENHAVCEAMGKNVLDSCWLRMTIWRMRIAYWVPKATNTYTKVV
jgi:hypothetical protein